jgi:hypothetical protein
MQAPPDRINSERRVLAALQGPASILDLSSMISSSEHASAARDDRRVARGTL